MKKTICLLLALGLVVAGCGTDKKEVVTTTLNNSQSQVLTATVTILDSTTTEDLAE